MHLSAAAAITPSGVPPIPNKISAPESGHAVDIAPATSPSGINRILAPASRSSDIKSSCLGRSRTTAVNLELTHLLLMRLLLNFL